MLLVSTIVFCISILIRYLIKTFGVETDPGKSVEDNIYELFKSNHIVD